MSDNATQIQLEAGSYEIIKSRLQDSKSTLRGKLDLLNTDRKNVFGGVETELKSTIRIHTDNNCVAQDIIALGDQCIFGFNVHIGLRAVTRVADVFATYSFDDGTFTVNQGEIIGDSQFSQDLENLYKYYRNSTFYRFWRKDAYLYMIFKVSEQDGDYKAFKWIVDGQSLRDISITAVNMSMLSLINTALSGSVPHGMILGMAPVSYTHLTLPTICSV